MLLGSPAVRIRDPIHGVIAFSDEERAVIDSRPFQRLRSIRQLGFGDLAFPGATHTRHAHSLGALAVATRLFDAVAARAPLSEGARRRFRAAVRLAVLCHDLGHMPFSHASESIAPLRSRLRLPPWLAPAADPGGRASHEDYSALLLLDSELTPVLERCFGALDLTPALVVSLVTGALPPSGPAFRDGGVDWTPLLRTLVSGELDADRMDYLLRDSFYTGVNYGRYDAEWILQNLFAAERDGRAVLALKGSAIFAFEDFLLSRFHMFLSVYFHHTSVAYDTMLRRFGEEAPGEFSIPSDPGVFVECDDLTLISALRRSANRWARRIVTRRGFKRVAQFTERDEGVDLGALEASLDDAGIEHFQVESLGVFSKYARVAETPASGDEAATDAEASLFVADANTGRLTEITRATPMFQRFHGGVRLTRLYADPDRLDAARAVVGRVLGRVSEPPGGASEELPRRRTVAAARREELP